MTATPTSPTATPTGSKISDDEAWARVPKDARAHTFAGAQAFAEFYMAQVNEAWQKPDPDAIRPYATDGCKSCRGYLDTAEEFKQRQQRYDRAPIKIGPAAWQPESTRARAVVFVLWTQPTAHVIDAAGKTVDEIAPDHGESSVELDWSGGRWKVSRIQLVVTK